VRAGRAWWRSRGGAGQGASGAAGGGQPLAAGDGWSAGAAAFGWHDPEQVSVLRQVLAPDFGARPTRRPDWAARVERLRRRENREAHAGLLALFEALAAAVPLNGGASGGGRPLLVGRENTLAAVNTVWAATELLGAGAARTLERILQRASDEPWTLDSGRVHHACVRALAEIGTKQALDMLLAASRRSTAKAQREQILLVLDVAARRTQQPPSRIAELHTPTHGLSGNGRRTLTVHKHVFELVLLPDGRVESAERDGATPDKAVARVIAAEARSLRAAYDRELSRIEALLATERSWHYEEWRRLYLDNPITRAVASRLVWRMRYAGGRTVDVLPTADGGVRVARPVEEGRQPPAPDADLPDLVRLWHPRDAEPAELAAWRAIRGEQALVQPFDQIERDFTRAEPDPDTEELNQYAATAVTTREFAEVLSRLGWHSRRSSGRSGHPLHGQQPGDTILSARREFPDDGVSVAVPCREEGESTVLGSGWFHRTQDQARTPVALGFIAPRVHSEALRDIAMLARGRHESGGPVTDAVP
jgi:hypothetical protein